MAEQPAGHPTASKKNSIPVLNQNSWREFRGVPQNAGINPTTHLATVADDKGTLRSCFVKLLHNSPALLCEALGYILADASGVSIPPFGAILLVPVDKLKQHVSLPNELANLNVCPAWCCELVAGKSVRQINQWEFFYNLDALYKSEHASKIAAFDQWTDLQDRNFGNVIRSDGGRFTAIDHETLLHEIVWGLYGLKWEKRCLTEAAKNHLSGEDFKRFQVSMVEVSERHATAASEAALLVEKTIDRLCPPNLVPQLKPSILSMLQHRSQPGWMSQHLKVLA